MERDLMSVADDIKDAVVREVKRETLAHAVAFVAVIVALRALARYKGSR